MQIRFLLLKTKKVENYNPVSFLFNLLRYRKGTCKMPMIKCMNASIIYIQNGNADFVKALEKRLFLLDIN